MANQTISVNRNGDEAAISGLANGEDYTVNTGATLTLNSDSRWGQQAAVVGNITIDSATGGTVRIDGRDVWWIPYDGGTGNVPALGTVGTEDVTISGGNVGEFLGVWTALGVAPTAAASAMPATGFIKLRRKTGTINDNDVLTLTGGATATVNSTTGGQRGWLHIVGEEASTITVPRLGLFEALGDWFELGTTNGATGQTLQFYVADQCPALWVETGAGTGVFELWLNAGTTRWGQTNRVAQDARGKFFQCTTAGVITLAQRVTVSNGQLPPTGCRVRVPNIHVSNSSTTNWTLNPISTTLGTRWDFTTTSAGAIVLDKVSGNWYPSFNQPYSLLITDCGVSDQVLVTECATKLVFTRLGVGLTAAVDAAPVSIASCFAGVELVDCVVVKYEAESNDTGATIADCSGVVVTGGIYSTFGDNTAATLTRGATTAYALTMTRVIGFTFTGVTFGGGGLSIVTCADGRFDDTRYFDAIENRTTSNSNGTGVFFFNSGCSDIVVDGFSNYAGLTNVHPYGEIAYFQNSYRCHLRNVGTPTVPYDCGSANACAGLMSLAGGGADHTMRRCYTVNSRTSPITTVNSDTRITIVNAFGDYADTVTLIALNMRAQGIRGTFSTVGQTSVYGTHIADGFTSATVGRLAFYANEPTALSGVQLQTTAGTPKYTSTGIVKLTTIGDQVVWEMDYFALGHTAVANIAPSVSGTNVTYSSGARWGNHDIEFQWDTGSGWNGSWLALTAAQLSTVGGGTVDPATGVKLKVRATCAVAAGTNAISSITVGTVSTALAQQIQYPLPGIQLTLTGLVTGSDIVVLVAGTETVRSTIEGNVGTTWVYDYTLVEDVDILVYKSGYVPFTIRDYSLSSANASLPVAQVADRNYSNP